MTASRETTNEGIRGRCGEGDLKLGESSISLPFFLRDDFMNNFSRMNDWDLVHWLGQYSGRQAGYYPGLRRSRVAAEREAVRRGLPWWRSQTHRFVASCITEGCTCLDRFGLILDRASERPAGYNLRIEPVLAVVRGLA